MYNTLFRGTFDTILSFYIITCWDFAYFASFVRIKFKFWYLIIIIIIYLFIYFFYLLLFGVLN